MTERYAARWSIGVAIEDARQVFGTGQARNRTARAVERTVPFQLACQAIATAWYATAGHLKGPRWAGRLLNPRWWVLRHAASRLSAGVLPGRARRPSGGRRVGRAA